MKGKKSNLFKLLAVLAVFFFFSGVVAESQLWTFRGELCYQSRVPDFSLDENLFVAAYVDYRAYESFNGHTSVFLAPRIVYNHSLGLDLQFGVRLEWRFVNAGHNFHVVQGASFPTNFLNQCVVYVRVNLSD